MGLVQYKARKGDPSGSLRALCALVERVAPEVDLLVLPEMAVTGYVFADRGTILPQAEAPQGPTFEALSALASRYQTWMVCGFPERDGPRLYNSAMVVDAHGGLHFTYRKTLLYDTDHSWAEPGDSGYCSFDVRGYRVGVGICMDFNDDRFLAWCAGEGVEVLALPTNWLEEGTDVWPYWAWRMQQLPGVWLVAANTWGPEEDICFSGRSVILRDRTVYGALEHEGDGALSVPLPCA